MYIRCKVCGSEKLICKYYPSSCWYLFDKKIDGKNLGDRVDTWFEEHCHDKMGSMFGATHFELSFETTEDDKKEVE